MKLVYLWIESYQFIQKQGYLLDSGYEVNFNNESKIWYIKKKASLDCLLYGNNICVTAIVGDNGAGKSTLLDAIRIMLFDKRERRRINGFFVWEENDNLKMIYSMGKKPCINYEESSVEQCSLPPEFDLIYYSDFLDLKYYLENFDDGEDVDTYIEELNSSFRNRDFVQVNISTSYLLGKFNNKVIDYFHSDIKKQITYYSDLKEKKLPFALPKNLSVKIEFLDIDKFDEVLDCSLNSYKYRESGHKGEINTKAYVIGVLETLKEIYGNAIQNPQTININKILQWNLLVTFIYNLLSDRKYNRDEKEEFTEYEQVDSILKKILLKKIPEEIKWEDLSKIFEGTYDNDKFSDYRKFYDEILQGINTSKNEDFYVEFSLSETIIEMPRGEDEIGWNGNWEFTKFMSIYNLYERLSYGMDFLKFSWGLSTGEGNMFNLFARLYNGMKFTTKKNVLLVFDEIDSSFHPQWQQDIMMQLTSYLRSVYSGIQFQILLTTHSPVLLSDIPKDNVLFLKKEESIEKNHEQTFAANIASLYYDSFFMDKGSVGNIAKRTIRNLLVAISGSKNINEMGNSEEKILSRFLRRQFPNGKESQEINLRDGRIQQLIDSIGEEIWRYKINKMYHEVLESKEDTLEMEIKKRLKDLEKKRGREHVEKIIKNWLQEDKE